MLCNYCCRRCNIDRAVSRGFCNIDDGLYISNICVHTGEEPVIVGEHGICNVFFDHCNLQCVYCQNYQISDNKSAMSADRMSLNDCCDKICELLDFGCKTLGFVSPTPYLGYIYDIYNELTKRGYRPITVYNTNSIDTVATIKGLEGVIDIYLPDYKYGSYELGLELSKIKDYPDIALAAISEMHRQKGDKLVLDKDGTAVSGMIIRHLVLPGHIENSKAALCNIAIEISPKVHISLMSQYYPVYNAFKYPELSRKLTKEEYEEVVDYMLSLGLTRGWQQEMESAEEYRPEFEVNRIRFANNVNS